MLLSDLEKRIESVERVIEQQFLLFESQLKTNTTSQKLFELLGDSLKLTRRNFQRIRTDIMILNVIDLIFAGIIFYILMRVR